MDPALNKVRNLFGFGNSQIHVGDNVTVKQVDNKCLADLRGTDPRLDKQRIEEFNGGLLDNLCNWVFTDRAFDRWRNDPDGRLLWVKGDAGKGKTMLLCSIINELDKVKPAKLAYFFCQASDEDLSCSVAVLRGLVYMLADNHSSLRELVEEKYDRAGRNLFWDNNAWFALKGIFSTILEKTKLEPMFIIIDALDECTNGLFQLLDLVITFSAESPHVKWIISSRNISQIERHLEESIQRTALRVELGTSSESNSFRTYLQSMVNVLATSRCYNHQTKMTVKLQFERNAEANFLWVALACQALEHVDSQKVIRTVHQFPRGLDCLYKHLLDELLMQHDSCTSGGVDRGMCRQVLAVAAAVSRPISLAELSRLVGTDAKDTERLVDFSHAFIALRGETIYFVHQSAKDFLLSPAASTSPLSINIAATHLDLFETSLRVMGSTLKHDIYELKRPGVSIYEVSPPDLDPLEQIRYCCVYWVDHLDAWGSESHEEVAKALLNGGVVDIFLRKCFLHWLEALSLLKSFPKGIRSIAKLSSLIQERRGTDELSALIQDAHRLMRFHQFAIENYPLQVYAAALIFSPKNSIIRHVFRKEEPSYIIKKPATEDDWSPLIQTLEGHDDEIVAMASNGGKNAKIVASASRDGSIKVWDVTTGERLHTLSLPNNGQSLDGALMAFPEDDVGILISTSGSRVNIWNLTTGRCEGVLEDSPGSEIIALSFLGSADSECVTLTAGGDIRIWNLETRLPTKTTKIASEDILGFAFGRIVHASLACDSSSRSRLLIRPRSLNPLWYLRPMTVWDIETGKCLQTIDDESFHIDPTALSHDGERVASNPSGSVIKIWEAATGKCLQTLQCRNKGVQVTWLAFSSDSTQLASILDGAVMVWSVESGQCLNVLHVSTTPRSRLHFVADSKYLAVSTGNTINILDVLLQEDQLLHSRTRSSIDRVLLSSNEKYLALYMTCGTLEIHDLEEGQSIWSEEPFTNVEDIRFVCSQEPCLEIEGYDRSIVPGGMIEIQCRVVYLPGLSEGGPVAHHKYKITGPWILRDSEKLLWLPAKYRPRMWYTQNVVGSSIAIGSDHGRIFYLQFDS
ncbi:hypothetical protein B0T10DRAFT_77769 [Thelonectria olida]|uniref:NACHT domain-containing protein n=1 Tax=Thelonectria olida TaxID=1576542 RepID=A0A9P9AHF4_9HYPO|nr:hypothetical protein B0T10DRAFT_77769 [Thelonectria olida]